MRKQFKRLFALLLVIAMAAGLLPTMAAAGGRAAISGDAEMARPYTEEDNAILDNDVFAKIAQVETGAATRMGGLSRMTESDYIRIVPQVVDAIKSSETYVPGTLQQNGNFLVWMTTTGMPCCYDPRMEAELHNTVNDPTPAEMARIEAEAEALLDVVNAVRDNDTRGGSATSTKIGLIQPYWESSSSYADSSFTSYSPYYKTMWQNLYGATGGTGMRYSMTNANITNIAKTIEECGLVIFDSHGTTDYSGSNGDYTSRANCSYLCLTTNSGITTADTQAKSGPYGTYYECMKGSGYAYVSGTCIANHMTKNAPHSLVYMGICLGMATDGMYKGLRQKGVEVVYGYSQSVSFTGEKQYMQSILGYVKNGDNFGTALSKAKNSLGKWDPAYSNYSQSQAVANHVAFPITVSSEDAYPGHGNVDAVQNVYSTWNLFGGGGGSNPGTNVTVTYSVPSGISAPASQTVASGSSITLPTVGAPSGYTFLGWVTSPVNNSTTQPTTYTGTVTVNSSVTLYALYSYTSGGSGSGGTAYQLLSSAPSNWAGSYIITFGTSTSSLYVLKGLSGNKSYESASAGGAVLLANTGMSYADGYLTGATNAYVFDVAASSSKYTIKNKSTGTYLGSYNSYLYSRTSNSSSYCRWTLSMNNGNVTAANSASSRYPYLAFSSSNYFMINSSAPTGLYFWKQTTTGGSGSTTYYTTN
ncbi:MAG: InlB B-repeat-containing protein [Oscillospiraceae bacterium]|nr:InlB B-repeat-containing protein [Oscillospiraceae bacterium]